MELFESPPPLYFISIIIIIIVYPKKLTNKYTKKLGIFNKGPY